MQQQKREASLKTFWKARIVYCIWAGFDIQIYKKSLVIPVQLIIIIMIVVIIIQNQFFLRSFVCEDCSQVKATQTLCLLMHFAIFPIFHSSLLSPHKKSYNDRCVTKRKYQMGDILSQHFQLRKQIYLKIVVGKYRLQSVLSWKGGPRWQLRDLFSTHTEIHLK